MSFNASLPNNIQRRCTVTLKTLETEYEQAERRLQECREVIDRESRAAVARIEAHFSDDRRCLESALGSAKLAMDTEKSRLALAGEGAPWPVGTRLTKQERVHDKYYSPYYSPMATPRYDTLFGVLEAVTSETQFPDNLGKGNIPPIGEFIVRLELKGGKLGKKFERPYNWVASGWKAR